MNNVNKERDEESQEVTEPWTEPWIGLPKERQEIFDLWYENRDVSDYTINLVFESIKKGSWDDQEVISYDSFLDYECSTREK